MADSSRAIDWLASVIERAKRAAEAGPRAMLKGHVRTGAKQ